MTSDPSQVALPLAAWKWCGSHMTRSHCVTPPAGHSKLLALPRGSSSTSRTGTRDPPLTGDPMLCVWPGAPEPPVLMLSHVRPPGGHLHRPQGQVPAECPWLVGREVLRAVSGAAHLPTASMFSLVHGGPGAPQQGGLVWPVLVYHPALCQVPTARPQGEWAEAAPKQGAWSPVSRRHSRRLAPPSGTETTQRNGTEGRSPRAVLGHLSTRGLRQPVPASGKLAAAI